MRSRTRVVACLLFGSGFCALVYQVAWLRDFRLIFGASTAASAAVLAIFIGGLGTGGLLLGGRVDRQPRPLAFYAQLESIVAVSAAVTPFLLQWVGTIYIASGGSSRLGSTGATMARLALSAVVLAVPTIAMGGTLPAAARSVTRDSDVRRQDVAALYAFNTLGAVAGSLIATFWLLELFGTRSTLWLAAASNALVAIIARQASRPPSLDVTQTSFGMASPALAHAAPAHPTPQHPAPNTQHPAPGQFVLLASAVVGFAFFLMELVWYRMLGPLLGGSVFTFGLVLATALAGIGAGGLLYALIAGDEPATLSGFAWSCLIEAAAIAGTYALGDRVAILALALVPLGAAGFPAHIAAWTLVASIVVFVPALVAGYQFPMLIALLGRGRDRIGRQVGVTYAANTLGAIAGSLAGGFGLLPWLSAPGAWRLVAGVLLLLGVAAIGLSREKWAVPLQVAVAVLTIVLMTSQGPTAAWRHSGIGAGRTAGDVFGTPNRLRAWLNVERRGVVWDADGTESAIALSLDPTGYSFIVNGKSDGSARGDAGTQIMLGLLGALATPHPRRALVIGLGTGSSAGWLAAVPGMERLDVVELEPLVLEVARSSQPVNRDVMNNPKVRVAIGDAREALLTSREQYDVIASEPSNPFRAGIASLFTVEYYRAANDRLTDEGVFAQWVQGYEIDARTLRTIYATMAAVFPHLETWQTHGADLVLVGSKRARVHSTSALATRIAEEPYKSALAYAWRAVSVADLLGHYLASDKLARAFAASPRAELNTDDRNVVEFGLARAVGRARSIVIADLRQAARQAGATRPPLDDAAAINWPAVDTAWVAFSASEGFFDIAPEGSPDEQGRQNALLRYFQNDLPGARNHWPKQGDAPRNPIELVLLADLEAEAGSDAALPLIERLRAYQPAEADFLLAKLRLRQTKSAEAASALESALLQLRRDPWPLLHIKEQAVDLAQVVGARDEPTARRMYEALRLPFAIRAMEDNRLISAADLSMRIDARALCRGAIGALEPHVPWTQQFLLLRHDCYEATGDPRLRVATRDLNEFLAHEALPLSVLISR